MLGPFGHLLTYSDRWPKTQLATTYINYYNITVSFGIYTPHIYARERWTAVGDTQFKKVSDALRWMAARDRRLDHIVCGERFCVVPPVWPEGVIEGFGLREPPTPYEAACALLLSPCPGSNDFWHLHMATAEERSGKSLIWWWLLGTPMEALMDFTGEPKDVLESHMRKFLQRAMQSARFALWAVGSDFSPLCTNRHTAQVAVSLLSGQQIPVKTKLTTKAARLLYTHPYIRTQIEGGPRLSPIQRSIYTPGVVWQSLDEKREWEKEQGPGAKQLHYSRDWLRRLRHPKPPEWASIP